MLRQSMYIFGNKQKVDSGRFFLHTPSNVPYYPSLRQAHKATNTALKVY